MRLPVPLKRRPIDFVILGFFAFNFLHLMPTVWVFLGLLPLYPALTRAGLGLLDLAAVLLTGIAIAIETIADRQLRRFLRTPHDPTDVLATGLWARCRHPNSLGEILFWWGLFLFGLAAQPTRAWIAACAPVIRRGPNTQRICRRCGCAGSCLARDVQQGYDGSETFTCIPLASGSLF